LSLRLRHLLASSLARPQAARKGRLQLLPVDVAARAAVVVAAVRVVVGDKVAVAEHPQLRRGR
jgi:hypothetical protein